MREEKEREMVVGKKAPKRKTRAFFFPVAKVFVKSEDLFCLREREREM